MSKVEHHHAGCRIIVDAIPIEGFWMSTWIVAGLLLSGETELEKDQRDPEQQALCDACRAIDLSDQFAARRR